MDNVTKEQLMAAKRLTKRDMLRLCPEVWELIKQIGSRDKVCLFSMDICNDSYASFPHPGFNEDEGFYFLTNEQISKQFDSNGFTVGDYILFQYDDDGQPPKGGVVKITNIPNVMWNGLWVYEYGDWGVVAGLDKCNLVDYDNPKHNLKPFYAPPSQELLDKWGMEIYKIAVPSFGDKYHSAVDALEEYHVKGSGSSYLRYDLYDGLRYILRRKRSKKNKDIKKAKSLIKEALNLLSD